MNLKEHLQRNGKTDSWINLANQFQVKGTSKQKSDYVRRLFRKIQKERCLPEPDWSGIEESINSLFSPKNSSTKFIGGQVNYCQTVGPDGNLSPQPEYVITTASYGEPDLTLIPNWNTPVPPQSMVEYLRKERLKKEWKEFEKWKVGKEFIQKKQLQPYLNGDINNVLFIGDLHLPFTAEGYLEFCRKQQERFNCGTVIYAGDLLDNHAQSFHNTDADGLSAKDELNLAIKQLEEWYRVFPKATVLLGNHDRIVARKLFSVGLSQRWMKPLGEVLNTPNYNYVEQYVFNNVLYVHGEGGTALKKAQNELMSVACGHSHTEGYVQFINGGKNFAMQVGCGIDFKSYAFAYAQRGKLPVLSCGAILNQSPILIPFI